MNIRIGDRELGVVLSALLKRQHYTAALNLRKVCGNPRDLLGRYLFGYGHYPTDVALKRPDGGEISLRAYTRDDIFTINEVFCRHDYPVLPADRVIVDFGSNIGVSAAYFLTAAPDSFVYLYEPLPTNTQRLRTNLHGFEARYELNEVAVGNMDGQGEFGWEPTGRYGGVGVQSGQYLSVACIDSNETLQHIIAVNGRIDVLKIDIEGLEGAIIQRLTPAIATRIDRIYAEHVFTSNPLAITHDYLQFGSIARFSRKH